MVANVADVAMQDCGFELLTSLLGFDLPAMQVWNFVALQTDEVSLDDGQGSGRIQSACVEFGCVGCGAFVHCARHCGQEKINK